MVLIGSRVRLWNVKSPETIWTDHFFQKRKRLDGYRFEESRRTESDCFHLGSQQDIVLVLGDIDMILLGDFEGFVDD